MSEIKEKVIQLTEGESFTAGPEEYLISEKHTLSDIFRFLVSLAGPGGIEDIQYLLDEYKRPLSCPCCGSSNIESGDNWGSGEAFVHCLTCNIVLTLDGEGDTDIISHWNRKV